MGLCNNIWVFPFLSDNIINNTSSIASSSILRFNVFMLLFTTNKILGLIEFIVLFFIIITAVVICFHGIQKVFFYKRKKKKVQSKLWQFGTITSSHCNNHSLQTSAIYD